jgi:transposase
MWRYMTIYGIIPLWRYEILKVSISKSKNVTIYYLSKSVRIGGKTTTKTIEKIGTYDEIKSKCGDMDPLDWAKQYAAKRTAEEKKSRSDILIKYSSSQLIEKNTRRSANIGYLFIQDIYYSLGLNKICDEIAARYKFDFDLNDILSVLVYSRIIAPGSKKSSLQQAQAFLEQPKCKLHQIYRGLEVLAQENDFFQSQLYKNSENVMHRNKGILYYDCTNYYFEIEEEDDFRKYGVSKEHRPNPIIQMGLFMDADGIPLSFSIFNGNENEQPSMTPLEEKIISDFGMNSFVVCTDAGLSSTSNRKFNNVSDRKFVTTQSIKKLKKFLQDFCLADDGWNLEGSKKTYKLSELDGTSDYDKTFYKERWINEDGLEQHLIVTFSLKYKKYQQTIRERQIERARKLVDKPSKLDKKKTNDPKRFINQDHCTFDGEVANKTVTSLDENQISLEEKYDGFYAVCTNLEDDAPAIVKINQRRWEIEECFRIMKSEFKARPVYLSRKDRITAHFMTCFTALIIYRILEKKLDEKYTCQEMINTLKEMNMLVCPGEGYIPEYTRSDLTDSLHDSFGFRTDYQIISQRNIKKICTTTKK